MIRTFLYYPYRAMARVEQRWRGRFSTTGTMIAGAMVAGATFGVDTRQTTAFEIAALSASLLLLALLATRFCRADPRVQRSLPRHVTVGSAFQYTLRVAPGAGADGHLALLDELDSTPPSRDDFIRYADPDEARGNPVDRWLGYRRWLKLRALQRGARIDPIPLPSVRESRAETVTASCLPLRRGHLRFRTTALLCPEPMGLMNAVRRQATPQSLLVLPRRYRVPAVHIGRGRRHQPGGIQFAGSVGDSREFMHLRDYRPGDSVRHIHWRSWARTGKPVVKEFQDEYFDRQAILLDTTAPAGPVFEEAVSLAASFVANDRGADALIDLLLVGHKAIHCPSGRGLGSREHMLEVLACATPRPDARFATLRALALEYATRLSSAICVLTAWDPDRQDLVRTLRRLDVPTLVLVVIAADAATPAVSCMADQPHRFVVLRAGRIEQELARYGEAFHG